MKLKEVCESTGLSRKTIRLYEEKGLLFGIVLGMGLNGFFLGHALAIWVTALMAFGYYLSGRWEHHKLAVQK